jgi:multidrug resistance efflux pump
MQTAQEKHSNHEPLSAGTMLAKPTRASMDIPRKPRRKSLRWVTTAVVVAVVIGGATFGLSRLKAAVPTVESVWPDTVKRGTMIRQVQGQGTLVPEEIRWISAASNGRVERIVIRPGTAVTEDSVIVELSNPDVELAALEAQRQVAAGQAELVNLQASVEGARLAQESSVATLKSSLDDAGRRAKADQDLADKGYLSKLELDQSKDRASELDGRLAFEKRRLGEIQKGNGAQVEAQRAQVERLKSIAEFRQKQVDALHVRAGVTGILQELPLQEGQAVTQGALLAKVAKPDKLKAELRIPETQIKDVAIGQKATIDTRNGLIEGKVSRIDPASTNATVKVDVTFTGELPKAARPELTVEGTIELERLENVLYVGRPAFGEPGATVKLYKMTGDGEAVRVPVVLGRTSVKTVEIVNGLAEGDTVILSDMSQWDNYDRVKVK